MKNKSFIVAMALVTASIVVFVGLAKFQSGSRQETAVSQPQQPSQSSGFQVVPAEKAQLIKPHSPMKGSATAKVIVVEYLDPECEACAAMAPIVKKVLSEHEGQVALVVRYMTYHQNSKLVANILEGARAENKYWQALEIIFETQGQWADHHNPRPELIPEVLKPLKLNMEKIMADAKAGKYDQQIMEDVADGKALGVRGTPTLFVNGHPVQELGYEGLKSAIVENLNK